MQSYFFHLMPWTDYPEDFDEKYESSTLGEFAFYRRFG